MRPPYSPFSRTPPVLCAGACHEQGQGATRPQFCCPTGTTCSPTNAEVTTGGHYIAPPRRRHSVERRHQIVTRALARIWRHLLDRGRGGAGD
jgi:hypothetical protein